MLVDTHCHLNHEQFAEDSDEVIARAKAAGVERMIVVGFDLPSSEQALALADQYRELYAAVAVHPHDAKSYDQASEERLRELAQNPKAIAIGEIGLDYHYDFSPRDAQFAAFKAQLALAGQLRLPVIIHCREAYGDTLDILEQEMDRSISGVMHCWGGDIAEAERALGLGMYLGIGGTVTFKNAENVRQAARLCPPNRLLLETDAPYLAPVPHRGKRNEPAFTALVAEKIAEIRNEDKELVTTATTKNAQRLFNRLT